MDFQHAREVLNQFDWSAAIDVLLIAVAIFAAFRLLSRTRAITLLRGAVALVLVLVILGLAFDLTAIQRQLKAVGIFARLFLSRGRGSHLDDIVPVLRRIAKLGLMYPETATLSAWLDHEVVPAAARRIEQLS